RRVDGKRNVQSIERRVGVPALVDVPGDECRALAFRGRTSKDARASGFAVAGFEVGAAETPLGHGVAPLEEMIGRHRGRTDGAGPSLSPYWRSSVCIDV